MSNEKTKRVALILITDESGDILMGRRNDNQKFSTPGGHCEPKEEIYNAGFRELKEETGLDAKYIKLVRVSYEKDKNIMLYLFTAEIDDEQEIDTSGDPDKEFDDLNYINPINVIGEMHVEPEKNLVIQYWLDN